ncbi:MAG: hypothetical protein Kow0042_27530 [Calditrichia bacterium]
MRGCKFTLIFAWTVLVLVILSATTGHTHGYVFSRTNEEMHDNVKIQIGKETLILQYESIYYGQIAPHTRNMIDANSDTVLTREEIAAFFDDYKNSLNAQLSERPFFINNRPYYLRVVAIFSSTLQTDSLLAPLKLEMILSAPNVMLNRGNYELRLDPRLLFENGTHLIRMAKERVEFTREQDEAIGRFLQLGMFSDGGFKFVSTYPGRIKKDKKSVFIHGVFYDKTILQMDPEKYQPITVKFISEQGGE